jgi:DNA-binding XRE family transcriptional regulator
MEVAKILQRSLCRELRCALIFLREVHINNESMLRYDYKEFSAALGKRVKQLRKERGLTLRALVIQHGFHLTQIQRIEKGDGLSVPTLLRIAEVFQIPVEKLIAGLGLVEGAESRSKSSKK